MSDLTITTAGVSKAVSTGNQKAGIKINVSPSGLQTSAHTAGDIVFTKIEMPNAVRIKGGTGVIREFVMFVSGAATDDDITLLFFDNNTVLGEPIGDPVTDVTASEYKASGCIGMIRLDGTYSVPMADGRLYRDSDGLIADDVYIKAQEDTTSIWVAAVNHAGTLDLTDATSIDINFIIEYLD
tara:strand:- start:3665 stop:4213 length:549 start_codon:yes stop_codon:yes gene_type:complete